MRSIEFLILILIVITAGGRKLECYECANHPSKEDSKSIPSCEGFSPNSSYEIKCENNEAWCITVLTYDGRWEIQERGCAGVMKRGTNFLQVKYTRGNSKNHMIKSLMRKAYDVVPRRYANFFFDQPDCTRETSSLKPNMGTHWCHCSYDLCNSVESIGPENSIAEQLKRKPFKCYKCSNNTCSKFQENSKHEINCGNRDSTFCFTTWIFNGLNWTVTERGCADAMKKGDTLELVRHGKGRNATTELDEFVKRGYHFVARVMLDTLMNPRGCHRNTSLLKSDTKDGGCFCRSDLCNSKMSTEHHGLMTKQSSTKLMKCYECSDDFIPCSEFQANSTFEIECDNDNSRFCSTTMESDGLNWTVRERSCAGLMIKNKRFTVRPNRRGENLSGYEFVSKKVMDLYGKVEYCGRLNNSFNHACSSNLCNAEIPLGVN